MTSNLLKLKDDRTELIIITTNYTTLSLIFAIHPFHEEWDHPGALVSCLIQPVFSMIVWTTFAKTLAISCIPLAEFKSILTTTEKIITFRVTTCLDYCNNLLYGITWYLVSQLQRCQNNAAHIVSFRPWDISPPDHLECWTYYHGSDLYQIYVPNHDFLLRCSRLWNRLSSVGVD